MNKVAEYWESQNRNIAPTFHKSAFGLYLNRIKYSEKISSEQKSHHGNITRNHVHERVAKLYTFNTGKSWIIAKMLLT